VSETITILAAGYRKQQLDKGTSARLLPIPILWQFTSAELICTYHLPTDILQQSLHRQLVTMSDAWNTADIKSALPDGNHGANGTNDSNGAGSGNPTTGVGNYTIDSSTKAPDGRRSAGNDWAVPVAYDYGEPDMAQVSWEGNAPVYAWDGQEGDFGPEYPELELELFGDPASRKEVRGIDFSK
jgi:hypothetical protein